MFLYISYKEHYNEYRNNPSFFFVYNRKKQPFAIIKFSAMIPVFKDNDVIEVLDYNKQDIRYKDLISSEYKYINSNKEEIHKRAQKMYKQITSNNNNFFKSIACDFKLLEKKSLEY